MVCAFFSIGGWQHTPPEPEINHGPLGLVSKFPCLSVVVAESLGEHGSEKLICDLDHCETSGEGEEILVTNCKPEPHFAFTEDAARPDEMSSVPSYS